MRYHSNISFPAADAIKLFILGTLTITLLSNLFFQLCFTVRFIEFTTDLTTKPKFTSHRKCIFLPLVLILLYGILLDEHEECWYFIFCNLNLDILHMIKHPHTGLLQFLRTLIFVVITLYTFYLAQTPIDELLCLVIFQNCCYFFFKFNCQWLLLILIALSNDVSPNPGPIQNAYFWLLYEI